LNFNKGKINVSVANIYKDGNYHCETISQAILGEEIIIQNREKNFSFVRMSDGYEGWISNYQWVPSRVHSDSVSLIRAHFVSVHSDPSEESKPVRDVTIGTRLEICNRKNDWVRVYLPDGLTGWIKAEAFGKFPGYSRESIIKLSREFEGYPYHWGGRSPKGFDCSGFVQRLHDLLGVTLPRDAWMQHRDAKYISDKKEDAKPGDLLFFAENGDRITHVALATGNMNLIHARGYVRNNCLMSESENYSAELENTFVDVRSYF
jgi:hypothetical protein